MGLFSMKSFILGLVLINMIVLNHQVHVEATRYLKPGVINPRLRSENTLAEYDHNKRQLREEANPYTRGCNSITRCRN